MWNLGYPHGWELSVVHSMQAWGVKLPKKVLSCAFGRPKTDEAQARACSLNCRHCSRIPPSMA